MFKYVELCVYMRSGRFAKDGLFQYRCVCQQVNISSLEEVIKHFMHLATERAELARSQARALEKALNVEDLEADKRPDDLMLSYVIRAKDKDKSDRELVTPWFKFFWETYRTVLKILHNNSKLEALYDLSRSSILSKSERSKVLLYLAELVEKHNDQIATFKTWDTGKPYEQAVKFGVRWLYIPVIMLQYRLKTTEQTSLSALFVLC